MSGRRAEKRAVSWSGVTGSVVAVSGPQGLKDLLWDYSGIKE